MKRKFKKKDPELKGVSKSEQIAALILAFAALFLLCSILFFSITKG